MRGLSSSGHFLCQGMFLPKAILRNPSLLTYNFHNTIEPAIALYEDIMRVSRKDLIPMLMYSNLEAVLRPRVLLTQKINTVERHLPTRCSLFGPWNLGSFSLSLSLSLSLFLFFLYNDLWALCMHITGRKLSLILACTHETFITMILYSVGARILV